MNKEQLEKLSDFEINKLIAEKLFRATYWKAGDKIRVDDGTPTGRYVDYCGNLSDMMPLAFANKINLTSQGWNTPLWCANSIVNHEFSIVNKNPLRAAAIVYLLMHGE